MSPVVNAVIAAAGLGSRLGLGLPKAMIEVAGAPLLGRLLSMLEKKFQTIHVVVGYREELLIDYCARQHSNVILVRNPQFRSTNTAQSYALGAQHLKGKTLFLDGDLLIEPRSLDAFLGAAARTDLLIGLTEAKSENAVYAQARFQSKPEEDLEVVSFSRDVSMPYEWANVFSGESRTMAGANGFVFEHLAARLPARAGLLELAEVDTADDLRNAVEFAQRHGL